jgi:hypothetical protein
MRSSRGSSQADSQKQIGHAVRRKEVTFKSASNYQRWKMALPHYLVRGHEKWTVCGRYTIMFMVTVSRTLD